ncbi:hypothetical protein PINS_up008786 [Pythium insidiosum]|nr:hypothetical protein PINS_up008786 [Pythium insidiosum]
MRLCRTLRDVPLVNGTLTLLLPPTIQHLVVVSCGLRELELEIEDAMSESQDRSGFGTSGLLEVDLHANELTQIPPVLFTLPPGVIK